MFVLQTLRRILSHFWMNFWVSLQINDGLVISHEETSDGLSATFTFSVGFPDINLTSSKQHHVILKYIYQLQKCKRLETLIPFCRSGRRLLCAKIHSSRAKSRFEKCITRRSVFVRLCTDCGWISSVFEIMSNLCYCHHHTVFATRNMYPHVFYFGSKFSFTRCFQFC